MSFEQSPHHEIINQAEGGGPPDWKFQWKKTGVGSIDIIYGDVVFHFRLEGGPLRYNKRSDYPRVSRHLTDAEYGEIRKEAERIFKALIPSEKTAAANLEESLPEQFKFPF